MTGRGIVKQKNPPEARLAGSRYSSAHASPGFLYWKVFHMWQREMSAALGPLGLTQTQYSVMATLSNLSGMRSLIRQQELADQLGMDKVMVSEVARRLESKGWLTRQAHPTDSRALCLQVSPSGAAVLGRAIPKVEALDEGFFGAAGSPEQDCLISILSRLMSQAAAFKRFPDG